MFRWLWVNSVKIPEQIMLDDLLKFIDDATAALILPRQQILLESCSIY